MITIQLNHKIGKKKIKQKKALIPSIDKNISCLEGEGRALEYKRKILSLVLQTRLFMHIYCRALSLSLSLSHLDLNLVGFMG
jgi:hypothetical protein